MSNKAQGVQTRLVQLGCLLVMLFLATPVIPRAVAQGNGAGARPIGNCFGSAFWDQYGNQATEPPVGIGSQQFEPAMAPFDNQAAGDFVIGGGWGSPYITGVRVMGEYSAGGGPASSFSIYFCQNGAGNLPGTLIAAFMNLPYVETPPDFLICLPYPFDVSPGTYWVSVQARQDSNPNGQWFWHNPTRALPGRTQVTATGLAASRGTGRALAWSIKYGPIRCFRFSGSVRGRRQPPNRSQHHDLARHQRLVLVRDSL